MLQKIAETMEYQDLLVQADLDPDPLVRFALIGCYAIAQYTTNAKQRLKPFNPVLGETFEIINKDFKFVAEQVCHHPPISASCGQNKHYEMYTHTQIRGRFTGKAMRFTPLGSSYITLKSTKETYHVKRPDVTINNLFFGKTYLDLDGDVIITNQTTGQVVRITCHKRGKKNVDMYKVTGILKDESGKEIYDFYGHWNRKFKLINKETGEQRVIWRQNPVLENEEYLYFYSMFALNLNYLDDHLASILPPTDSRFREDQRALENGDIKKAAEVKNNIEQSQRKIRKQWEKDGREFKPKYFVESVDEISKEKCYIFNRLYWEDREKGDWSRIEKMW